MLYERSPISNWQGRVKQAGINIAGEVTKMAEGTKGLNESSPLGFQLQDSKLVPLWSPY